MESSQKPDREERVVRKTGFVPMKGARIELRHTRQVWVRLPLGPGHEKMRIVWATLTAVPHYARLSAEGVR
jgi:hypothetical protein